MRTLFIIILASIAFQVNAQKKPLIEAKEKIIETAVNEINNALKPPEGELYLWSKEMDIKGVYYFQITIGEKGKVLTVFCSDRKKDATIEFQNKLKDRVLAFEFNFKMPKKRRYKFDYIFEF